MRVRHKKSLPSLLPRILHFPISPILVGLLLLLIMFFVKNHIHFFQKSNAQTTFSQIRSITYYEQHADDSSPQLLSDLTTDLPTIKAAGFNTVWLVSPWYSFEPIATPSASYNDAAFTNLTNILSLLKNNNMQAILNLNYLGQGWSPQGIDPCTWISDPTQYSAFEAYVQHFLTSISAYSSNVYIMVATEGTDDCGTLTPSQQVTLLQNTLGSLPTRLPPTLRSQFLIGYHDNSLVALNTANGASPIITPNPFDFVSMAHGYNLEGYTNAQINQILTTRMGYFTNLYPSTPLIFGEFGGRWCTGTNTDANQARVDQYMATFSKQHNLGYNVWGYKPLDSTTECSTNPSAGLGLTNQDGSQKPAFFTPSITSNGLSTSYSPWAVWMVGNNLTPSSLAQVIDTTGSEWGNDTAITYATSSSSFQLPANVPPSQCNVGKTCTLTMRLVNPLTGLASALTSLTLPSVTLPVITISNEGLNTSYTPWVVWATGSNFQSSYKAHVFDTNGQQWGSDLPITYSTFVSFSLPSNTPPSKCNIGKTCVITFQIFDPITTAKSNTASITLPAQ